MTKVFTYLLVFIDRKYLLDLKIGRFCEHCQFPIHKLCQYSLLIILFTFPVHAQKAKFKLVGFYNTGVENVSAVEIADFDPISKRLFSTNGHKNTLDILDLSNPKELKLYKQISLEKYGSTLNSISIHNGIVAVAIQAKNPQENGLVVFFDSEGNELNKVSVGALPDMVKFSPNGKLVLVANEGEPNWNYSVDPEGSISIIDVSAGVKSAKVTSLDFKQFTPALLDKSTRIFGKNADIAQDLEPEYIAISKDSKTAYVCLQENNAFAIVDLETQKIREIKGLGFKNFGLTGNSPKLDLEHNSEDSVSYHHVFGMFQPDAIASFTVGDRNYVISANEGDTRKYANFSEIELVKNIQLDEARFHNHSEIQKDEVLGKMQITNTLGNSDGDNDYDSLFTFGAKSFTIWDENANLVFDSGNQLAKRVIENTKKKRRNKNPNKRIANDDWVAKVGVNPEAVCTFEQGNKTFAFIGLEQLGGILLYDISNPELPIFVEYLNSKKRIEKRVSEVDFSHKDYFGLENLIYVSPEKSPSGKALLIAPYEALGMIAVYEVKIK